MMGDERINQTKVFRGAAFTGRMEKCDRETGL
jgi:hypothetical protein